MQPPFFLCFRTVLINSHIAQEMPRSAKPFLEGVEGGKAGRVAERGRGSTAEMGLGIGRGLEVHTDRKVPPKKFVSGACSQQMTGRNRANQKIKIFVNQNWRKKCFEILTFSLLQD